jgi:hypothetical protein
MAKANGTRSRSGAASRGSGSREGLSTALHRADMVGPRIELDTQDDGPEHRAFPAPSSRCPSSSGSARATPAVSRPRSSRSTSA